MKMVESISKRERNTEARNQINRIAKEFGVRYSFIARQMGVDVANFNHWRHGKKYEYGVERLYQVEAIIEKYNLTN